MYSLRFICESEDTTNCLTHPEVRQKLTIRSLQNGVHIPDLKSLPVNNDAELNSVTGTAACGCDCVSVPTGILGSV